MSEVEKRLGYATLATTQRHLLHSPLCFAVVLLLLARKKLEKEEKASPTGEARDVWVPAVLSSPNRNTHTYT